MMLLMTQPTSASRPLVAETVVATVDDPPQLLHSAPKLNCSEQRKREVDQEAELVAVAPDLRRLPSLHPLRLQLRPRLQPQLQLRQPKHLHRLQLLHQHPLLNLHLRRRNQKKRNLTMSGVRDE